MQCDFCDELSGIDTVYNEIYGNKDRFVFETKNFFVFPCMGQLREGHLLIVSKHHINAMSMLGQEALAELDKLILLVGEFYKSKYDMNMLCFEHGVSCDDGGNGGCGIYHMHLHILPLEDDVFTKILYRVENQGTNKAHSMGNLIDLRHCVKEKETYIFLEQMNKQQKKQMYTITNQENYFESQYMRRVISEIFGKKEWNWRNVKEKEEEFLNTLEESRNFFLTKQVDN